MQKDYTKQENSKSEDGTEPCKKCDGEGWIPMNEDPDCEYGKPCPLCEGEGVVDWVRKIMGYCKPKYVPYFPQTNVKPVVTNFKIEKE